MVLIDRLSRFFGTHVGTAVKWALMSAAVFWTLVYTLAARGQGFPEFVYVNF
jgi:hypothetical protein